MTDTLEAPPSTSASTEGYSPDNAQSIFNPESAPSGGEPSQAPASEVKSSQVLVDSPKEAATQEKADIPRKKSAVDKMGALKKPEAKVEAKVEQTKEAEGEAKPQKTATSGKPDNSENIRVLRERLAEAEKIKHDYESLKSQHDLTTSELTKLKAMQLNESQMEEYLRYRDLHAVEAIKNSDEYKQNILSPIMGRIEKLKSLAENIKLPQEMIDKLYDAVDIQDDWERDNKIAEIIESAELSTNQYQNAVKKATDIATDLNENWYPKQDEILSKASEIELAARQRDQLQAQQLTEKQQAEFKKEMGNVYNVLTTQVFKPLVEDTDLSIDGTTLIEAMQGATVPDNPQDMAAAAQVLAASPFLIQKLNKLIEENHQLKEANRLRNGASPSRSDGLPKAPSGDGNMLTAEDVFKTRR